MSEAGNVAKSLRERLGGTTEERLGKALSELLENPLLTGAIGRAFEAREKVSEAQEVAMGALNLPSAADIERLTRRLRAVSHRLEGIEDGVDRLDRALTPSGVEARLIAIEGHLRVLTEKVEETIRGAAPSPATQTSQAKAPRKAARAKASKAPAKAKAAASDADVVVAVLGEISSMSSESASRATLDLPGIQQQMLETVVATGKPVVLVLENGRPLDIRWASEHVPAILEAWYPGTEGGDAVADVLFGEVNPGGKLPLSWPRVAGAEPLYYNHNLTHEPEDRPNFTSRYWDINSKPLYPFGYGLSYTDFKFSNLHIGKNAQSAADSNEVTVDVTNTGSVAGDAVAQLYIHQRYGSASRPVRQLEGFERIALKPGETRTVKFVLGENELHFWSPQTRKWVVEPSAFDVWAGGDSTAPLHGEFTVTQ